jgi:hypothetical protein
MESLPEASRREQQCQGHGDPDPQPGAARQDCQAACGDPAAAEEQVAQSHKLPRYQNSIGIREAQDEIAKTLTPLYVAFEMTQALQAIATSGQNNSVIYLPTNPVTGLPIVPVTNAPQPGTAKP